MSYGQWGNGRFAGIRRTSLSIADHVQVRIAASDKNIFAESPHVMRESMVTMSYYFAQNLMPSACESLTGKYATSVSGCYC